MIMSTIMKEKNIAKLKTIADSKARDVLAYVRFGMVSKKCQNYGICEVHMIKSRSGVVGKSKKRVVSNIEVTTDHKLKFSFDTTTITDEGQAKYFGRGYFKMGEAYTLPSSITKKLGISPHSIESGNYPIIDAGTKKIILFDLIK